MESEWNITAPSAGHYERLRTQRLTLSRALASVADRTMALSSWKGDYPIGAAEWANTDKSAVLGGPLNCTTLKDLASAGGAANGDAGANHQHSGGGANNNSWSRSAASNVANPTVSLSQQVVATALQNGIIILFNTINLNKSPLFVPSDIKTTSSTTSGSGGSNSGGWGSSNNSSSSTGSQHIEPTVAASLHYGHLAAVAVGPLAYNKTDVATKVALTWVLQDAIAVCQLDVAKRDPNVENLHKVAAIPAGLVPSGILLQFSNFFEWGHGPLSSPSVANSALLSTITNSESPSKARLLVSVVAESETATSRLLIALQESDGSANFKPISCAFAQQQSAPGTTTQQQANSWGLIHGEVIFAQWLPNPKPSQLVLKAALLADRDSNTANETALNGSGSGYTSRYRNYNNRGYNNSYRRGGGGGRHSSNNNYDDGDDRRDYDNHRGGVSSKRYEDHLPSGLQPDGGPALLLLGTSDCRLILIQVFTTATTTSTTTQIAASALSWRVVSETLIAHDSPTQHMSCFASSQSAATDSASVLSLQAAMIVGGGGEEGAATEGTTTSTTSVTGGQLTASSLTTSVTTEYIVSYVCMGNVIQNATLEVTWPLQNGLVGQTAAAHAVGQKREREVDGNLAADPRTSHVARGDTLSSTATFPLQHLLHLQPLASLSTDDFYIQSLSAGVFGNIPVFTIALSTGAIIVLDGKSLTALHIFYFERNKHSTLTLPLLLVPREQPPMIAVVDDENLTVVKERR